MDLESASCKIAHMETSHDKNSTLKQMGLFVGGVLVVGGLVFLLKSPNDQFNKDTTMVPTATPVATSIPNEEVQGAITEKTQEVNLDQKENTKMTVEQKLAVKAPTGKLDAAKTYTATLKTNLGDIVLTLDAKTRPITVNNFVYLARLGFYNEVIFHRVISGFMIQGGDPLGTGTGGPAYKFADELTAPNSNVKGTISMANAGPNTNGSQFFINLVDNNFLDTKHTVFGKVTGGMDVVESIGKTPVGAQDRPVTPVVISLVEISEL